jgi:hypothetical protein
MNARKTPARLGDKALAEVSPKRLSAPPKAINVGPAGARPVKVSSGTRVGKIKWGTTATTAGKRMSEEPS